MRAERCRADSSSDWWRLPTVRHRLLSVDQLDQLAALCDDAVVTLNLYEAKTQLSALVDKAAAGAEIVIAKNGRPMAKLVPLRAHARRQPGRAKGRIWMAADFDAPLPADVLDAFSDGPVE